MLGQLPPRRSKSPFRAKWTGVLAALAGAGSLASGCGAAPTSSPFGTQAGAVEEALPAAAGSDDFQDPASLGAWPLYSPTGAGLAGAFQSAAVTDGTLRVVPQHGAWYAGGRTAHLYRAITGDFVASTHVIAGRPGAPAEVPTSLYNDAGLLARDPSVPGGESWIAALVGQTGGTSGTLAKTTRYSSTWVQYLAGGHAGELRICRVGTTFRTLRRLDGEAGWTVLDSRTRADLPATLSVGPVVNAWAAPVDVEARFDHVRYAVPGSLADCTRDIAAPTPPPPPPAPTFVIDERFDSEDTLADWIVREEAEGDASHTDLIDVNGVTPGRLTLDPSAYSDPTLQDGGAGPAWFQDRKGVFLYRGVTGDFSAMVDLRVGTRDDIDTVPTGTFNSAGLLVRDPSSFDPADPDGTGDERWVVYNLGWQSGFVGTETKATFPGAFGSVSSLFLTPVSSARGQLVICRVGPEFRFFRRLEGETSWTEDLPSNGNLVFDGANLASNPRQLGFVRPDIGADVQLGLMVNRWADGASPVRADFDTFQVAVPNSIDDCLSAFSAP